jgi:predicted metal-dependent HD superfamily phosphohydrolase
MTTRLPDDLVAEIRAMHEGENRGYHAWSHPLRMLDDVRAVRDRLHDLLAVRCAIVTHDVVYDPRRRDNEERSAAFARSRLAGHVPDGTLDRVVRMVEATARHAVQDGLSADDASDTSHFLDLDLSIFGADPAAFEEYERGVRHEYRHVDLADYAAARAGILRAFLARGSIYLTEWGRDSFEMRARRNVARSIEALDALV